MVSRSKAKKKAGSSSKTKVKKADPLYPSKRKSFRIGQDILPKGRDLGRYVKWPRYIRLQRQKKILLQRLKVPPAINQFSNKLDKSQATNLLTLLAKYRPEDAKTKKERLKKMAEQKVKGQDASTKPKNVVKFGLKHVTTLIEEKKAKLVVIASDVEPLELVLWMPALCRKMDVPYCIVNNKGRLGSLVYQKNTVCLALTQVNKEDEGKLATLAELCRAEFNDNKKLLKTWGGGQMGLRTQCKLAKRAKAMAEEEAKKQKMLV